MINVIIVHSLKHGTIIYSKNYSKHYYSEWQLETLSDSISPSPHTLNINYCFIIFKLIFNFLIYF